MSGFFDRMLGRGKENSAGKAKERLQFVLVHDRINLPPERLKEMKQEILAVISKYVKVANEEVDIALEQRDRNSNRLIAEIPFSESLDLSDESSGDSGESEPSRLSMMLELEDEAIDDTDQNATIHDASDAQTDPDISEDDD